MAAKIITTQSNIQVETVAQNFSISRTYQGNPGISHLEQSILTLLYNVNLSYGDNEFLLDSEGNRTRILSQNRNSKYITLTQEKISAFMLKSIVVDGVITTLGDLLANLMDAEIIEDMNKPEVSNKLPNI